MTASPPGAVAPPPPPRWFLLLPLLAVAAWWPLSPCWQSDDFIAVHYASDFGRVLHDFVGPQYGATDVWCFYRPLVTLSFWLDQCLGGADPFVSHLSNVLAHGVSAWLVGSLWRRFLPDGRAFFAGLLWFLMPSHVAALAWAVGRVDSHTAVWCLLALWLSARANERRSAGERARAWPAVLALAAALASKELAVVVPPLAALVAFVRTPGTFVPRVRHAVVHTLPLLAVLAVYLGLRMAVFGGLGGYTGMHVDPGAALSGLAYVVADLCVPLRWIGLEAPVADTLPRWLWTWSAAVPLLVAVVHIARRPAWLAALGAFLLALVPMVGFLAAAENPHNLRYYYLPAAALAGLLAAPGRLSVLILLAWAWPFVAVRAEQRRVDREGLAMHAALLREAPDAPSPMFVAGLPHTNAAGTAIQFHFGVDRMLMPPFGPGTTRLYALRPLAVGPGIFRLFDDIPFALPAGSTWFFPDSSALGRAPEPPPLPELVIAGDDRGVVDFGSERLRGLLRDGGSFGLTTPGVRPAWFRLTLFTANGYLACGFPDHGPRDAVHGTIDARTLFAGPPEPARFGLGGADFFGEALPVPTTIDLDTDFPVLLEAGDLDPLKGVFVPTHRARRLLTFRFDRGYPAWMREAQGTGP